MSFRAHSFTHETTRAKLLILIGWLALPAPTPLVIDSQGSEHSGHFTRRAVGLPRGLLSWPISSALRQAAGGRGLETHPGGWPTGASASGEAKNGILRDVNVTVNALG